ncbi:Gfo/Idh/MocA family protein [Curvivirga aplysinae]|uniref:Gfo/Idh/MocA family protein n=1 Tax=Curvivirga aplysinae TaxID=2529852 RepID=UPI0012BBACA6|nr:Gfo/Idh/MocA family oxidoreductase [Curvivirga aplysinae]MTI10583.1 Gfo/Idh/MocA family oxidoreductase [Curvivirga aplysinae]
MTESKPLKVGVIGLGVGEQHVKSYNAIPNVEVSSICDINHRHANEVGLRRHVSDCHTDPMKIIEDPEIDVISICSYDNFHADQAVAAFENGKHVFVEKPIALNKPDMERVIRAQQDSGKKISSNLILRESPRFKEIRQMVQNDEFGDIYYMEGDYIHQILWKITEGWRGAMDFYCITYGGGIHLIDLMRWIIGKNVIEVTGMGVKKATNASQFKYPDIITNLLRFDDEVLAKTTTMFMPQRHKFHSLNIYGSKLSFENGKPHARLFNSDEEKDESPFTTPYPAMAKGDLLPDFIEAIRKNEEPNVGAKDVYSVMDICFACWESVKEKKTVPVSYSFQAG